jgi:hypothetical protein
LQLERPRAELPFKRQDSPPEKVAIRSATENLLRYALKGFLRLVVSSLHLHRSISRVDVRDAARVANLNVDDPSFVSGPHPVLAARL